MRANFHGMERTMIATSCLGWNEPASGRVWGFGHSAGLPWELSMALTPMVFGLTLDRLKRPATFDAEDGLLDRWPWHLVHAKGIGLSGTDGV